MHKLYFCYSVRVSFYVDVSVHLSVCFSLSVCVCVCMCVALSESMYEDAHLRYVCLTGEVHVDVPVSLLGCAARP